MIVSEKLEPKMPFVLVLTFDGRRERGLLEGVADRFNGRILLWFPPTRGKRGLKVVCEDLKLHLERAYKHKSELPFMSVLVLGDKEHFRAFLAGQTDMRSELESAMTDYGIEVLNIEQTLTSRLCALLMVEGRHGHRAFRALVVVLGEQKSTEENLALLSERLGLARPPSTARELRKLLRDRERVRDGLLKEVFPCLCAALRELQNLLETS